MLEFLLLSVLLSLLFSTLLALISFLIIFRIQRKNIKRLEYQIDDLKEWADNCNMAFKEHLDRYH